MNERSSLTLGPEAIARAWRSARPDLDHSGLSIALYIRSIAMLIDETLSEIAAQHGLDHKELILLFALRRGGATYRMRPTDIIKLLKMTSGAATYRVTKMLEKGIVERAEDTRDRRNQCITLTPKGERVIDDAVGRLATLSSAALGDLAGNAPQLAQLNELLHIIGDGWVKLTPDERNPLNHNDGG